MANTSVWEEAWNKAQPRLSSIRDRLNLHGSPNPRIIRVGQLDSELLDREIVQLLQEPLNNTLSLINVCQKAIHCCDFYQSYMHTGFLKSAV
jgi:peroxin-2